MIIFLKLFKKLFLILACIISINAFSEEKAKSGVNFGGFIQYDGIYWIGDNSDDFIPGIFLKDISMFADWHYNENLNYFISFNLSNDKTKNSLADVYVKYSSSDFNLKFGKFVPELSLEETATRFEKKFFDNGLLKNNFDNNFLGLSLNFDVDNYKIFISVITPEFLCINKKIKNDDYSFLFRTVTQVFESTNLKAYAGLNYSIFNKSYDEEASLTTAFFKDLSSFSTPYSLLMSHPSYLPKYHVLGAEFFADYRSLKFQTEIRFTDAVWKDFDSEIYKSFYVQLSYDFNSQNIPFKLLTLGLLSDFSPKIGLFELAFRYNYINITNEGPLLRGVSQSDGKKDSYNFNINWFINNKLKIQLAYAYENFCYRIFRDRSISAIGFRAQLEF